MVPSSPDAARGAGGLAQCPGLPVLGGSGRRAPGLLLAGTRRHSSARLDVEARLRAPACARACVGVSLRARVRSSLRARLSGRLGFDAPSLRAPSPTARGSASPTRRSCWRRARRAAPSRRRRWTPERPFSAAAVRVADVKHESRVSWALKTSPGVCPCLRPSRRRNEEVRLRQAGCWSKRHVARVSLCAYVDSVCACISARRYCLSHVRFVRKRGRRSHGCGVRGPAVPIAPPGRLWI